MSLISFINSFNIDEIQKRQKYAKELDDKLKQLLSTLDPIVKEINNLNIDRECISSNLYVLKQRGTVASISEFKQNKADLIKTINRLSMITSDRIRLEKALEALNKLIEDNRQAYAKLFENAQTVDNVILEGNFGDNKDG